MNTVIDTAIADARDDLGDVVDNTFIDYVSDAAGITYEEARGAIEARLVDGKWPTT